MTNEIQCFDEKCVDESSGTANKMSYVTLIYSATFSVAQFKSQIETCENRWKFIL